MSDLTIAVLRGGPSSEYEVSLKSGAAIINALDGSYKVLDILIDRSGNWHRNGVEMSPTQALLSADVAVIALHGAYGEDGTVQRILDKVGLPYTGSDAYASALAMHKPRTRFAVAGLSMIKFPEHFVVREDDAEPAGEGVELQRGKNYNSIAQDIFKRFGPPYIVKPASGGSSVGLTIANSIIELPEAIRSVAEHTTDNQVLVEQLIKGRETTCGVVENYRDQQHYALPPVEIITPTGKTIFDYDAKYSTDAQLCAQEICPADFTREEKAQIEEAAKAVHIALDLAHYSRSDFILSPHGLYFLEVNTLPGLTEQSLLPKSLDTIGSSLKDFLEHIVELAMSGNK